MIVTLSKNIENDIVNIGPSELNWKQTPFICGTDICRDFCEYVSIDMRRLRSLNSHGKLKNNFISFVKHQNKIFKKYFRKALFSRFIICCCDLLKK